METKAFASKLGNRLNIVRIWATGMELATNCTLTFQCDDIVHIYPCECVRTSLRPQSGRRQQQRHHQISGRDKYEAFFNRRTIRGATLFHSFCRPLVYPIHSYSTASLTPFIRWKIDLRALFHREFPLDCFFFPFIVAPPLAFGHASTLWTHSDVLYVLMWCVDCTFPSFSFALVSFSFGFI